MIHDFTALLTPWSFLIYSVTVLTLAIAFAVVGSVLAMFEESKNKDAIAAKRLDAQIEFNKTNPEQAYSYGMNY